jgi:hypothetical protein
VGALRRHADVGRITIREHAEALERANRQKGDLLAMLGHVLGSGRAIVSGIVRAHGGTIEGRMPEPP